MSETQLELQIISSSKEAVEALGELEKALGRVQSAISDGLKDYEEFNQQMKEFSKGLDEAISDETVKKFDTLSNSLTTLQAISKMEFDSSKITSFTEEINNNTISEDTDKRFENLANSLTMLQIVSRMSFDSSGIASFAGEINNIASGLNELDLTNVALKTIGPAIGQTLGNVLGHFFSSGAETIETVWNITTNFNNNPLDNNTEGWMIDEVLTPALGSVVAADLKSQIMESGSGSVEVPITFTVNGTSSITATITESASGITLEDMQDAVWRSLIGGLDANNSAFGKGFSIDKALSSEGAVVDTGITIAGSVSVAIELVPDGGISWADKKSFEEDIQAFIGQEEFAIESNGTSNKIASEYVEYITPYLISAVSKNAFTGGANDYENFRKSGEYVDQIAYLYGLDEKQSDDLSKQVLDLTGNLRDSAITSDEFNEALTLLIQGLSDQTDQTEQTIDTTTSASSDLAAVSSSLASAFSAVASAAYYAAGAMNSIPYSSASGHGGKFAEGGFPEIGSLFIAREAGPELVGTIGSRTAVANNDQIVEGISSGVASGQAEQNALLRQQNEYLRAFLNKEFTAKVVPSAALGKTMRQSAEMYTRNAGV